MTSQNWTWARMAKLARKRFGIVNYLYTTILEAIPSGLVAHWQVLTCDVEYRSFCDVMTSQNWTWAKMVYFAKIRFGMVNYLYKKISEAIESGLVANWQVLSCDVKYGSFCDVMTSQNWTWAKMVYFGKIRFGMVIYLYKTILEAIPSSLVAHWQVLSCDVKYRSFCDVMTSPNWTWAKMVYFAKITFGMVNYLYKKILEAIESGLVAHWQVLSCDVIYRSFCEVMTSQNWTWAKMVYFAKIRFGMVNYLNKTILEAIASGLVANWQVLSCDVKYRSVCDVMTFAKLNMSQNGLFCENKIWNG